MEMLKIVNYASVEDILRTLNVPVSYIMPDNKRLFENERGATIKVAKENRYWVYIRSDLPNEEKKRVLCHELGHIVLGHMTDEKFPFMSESQREKEANEFASFIFPYIYKKTNNAVKGVSI